MSFHGESCECADCGYNSGYAEGLDDGIREGERRMLQSIVIGAEWWAHFDRFRASTDAYAVRDVQRVALLALVARGDDDASRVLGERGW